MSSGAKSKESKDAEQEKKPICFVMMPISDAHGYESGHFSRVYEYVFKPAIERAGFHPERADDTVKTDYIVVGIVKKIIDAEMVLCDMSGRNPNVLYELGLRHAYQKKVVLTKDRATDKIFDVQGLRYTEYDGSLRVDTVQKDVLRLAEALKSTEKAKAGDVNSIVQLAGISAASLPTQKELSPDTALLLDAIQNMGRNGGGRPRFMPRRSFERAGTRAIRLRDGHMIEVGEPVFLKDGSLLGVLKDVHPEKDICLLEADGRPIHLDANDPQAEGISGFPF